MTKKAFVIAPLGAAGSKVRTRSDQVLRHIIRPALHEAGYTVIRADEISEPGIITTQLITHLLEDELVVADLTGRNPNVFYELGIRHSVQKPTIHLIERGETIPFDVANTRFIIFDHRDLDSAASAREEIIRMARSIEASGGRAETPVTVVQNLYQSRSQQPVTIRAFVADADPVKAEQLAKAVELFTEALGLVITQHGPEKDGSWWKDWWAKTVEAASQPEVAERLYKAERAVELQALHRTQAGIDHQQAEAASALIKALEGTSQAAVQVGSLLIVKTTDSGGKQQVFARTLTVRELQVLESNPALLGSPAAMLEALDAARQSELPSAVTGKAG